jgi:hypothetical protein
VVNKLAIIVLNYNKVDLLDRCLTSLIPHLDKSVGVIVVDNGSSDNSVELVKKFKIKNSKLKIHLIENQENLGFTGGNNVGINYALAKEFDYIMLLNNDVLIKDSFWRPMVDYLKKNPQIGVLGPKIYFASGFEFHHDKYSENERGKVIWYAGGKIDWNNVYPSHRGVDEVDTGQYDQISETEFVTGCCLLASSDIWEKIGGLDDRYYLYYEDVDFCLKAKEMGLKIVYFPQSAIWHMNAGSSQSGGNLQDYYSTRNRMLFGMSWAPFRAKAALMRESLKLILTGRKWQKIGIKDYYLGRFGRGSWR